jgi:hypothetical protein
MDLLNFLLLFIIWLFFWYSYNFLLLPKKYSTEGSPLHLGLIYISLGIFSLSIGYGQSAFSMIPFLVIITLIAIVLFFIRKRETGRLLNSFFQIIWLYSFTGIVGSDFRILALIFFVAHLPVFFVKHLNPAAKLLILAFALFGGLIISAVLVYIPPPYSLFIGIALHYFTYLLIRPVDKKYQLHIIN